MNGEIIVRANISKRASAYISNIRRVEGSKTITDNTPTTLVGVLCGDGETIGVKDIDTIPTDNSDNLITSGGVKAALNGYYVVAGKKSGTRLGNYATAEGYNNVASGIASHAEGNDNIASGIYSHAEGSVNVASGGYSHAEGNGTQANGGPSHAEGTLSLADGDNSHAEGLGTMAKRKSQHVFGEYNIYEQGFDPSSRGAYIEIVGNGTKSNRSNARTLDWSGNETLAGKLTLGANPSNDMDAATKKYVDDAIAAITDGNDISY